MRAAFVHRSALVIVAPAEADVESSAQKEAVMSAESVGGTAAVISARRYAAPPTVGSAGDKSE